MIEKTKGIFLRSFKYSDSSVIAHIYTEKFGRQSFIIRGIHSKKSQSNRTTVSSNFRKFTKGILFTTDVSARGVDYPNVTRKLSGVGYIHHSGELTQKTNLTSSHLLSSLMNLQTLVGIISSRVKIMMQY